MTSFRILVLFSVVVIFGNGGGGGGGRNIHAAADADAKEEEVVGRRVVRRLLRRVARGGDDDEYNEYDPDHDIVDFRHSTRARKLPRIVEDPSSDLGFTKIVVKRSTILKRQRFGSGARTDRDAVMIAGGSNGGGSGSGGGRSNGGGSNGDVNIATNSRRGGGGISGSRFSARDRLHIVRCIRSPTLRFHSLAAATTPPPTSSPTDDPISIMPIPDIEIAFGPDFTVNIARLDSAMQDYLGIQCQMMNVAVSRFDLRPLMADGSGLIELFGNATFLTPPVVDDCVTWCVEEAAQNRDALATFLRGSLGDDVVVLGSRTVPSSDQATPASTTCPLTSSPTTSTPTTASPTTAAPTTASPTTAAPTTASPTTAAPTTASPTTASPTTAAPTTASPTTASPTTAAPTTAAPTTAAPTTAAPTAPPTASPTTSSPTALPTSSPTTALPTFPPTGACDLAADPTLQCCVNSDCKGSTMLCTFNLCLQNGDPRFVLVWSGDGETRSAVRKGTACTDGTRSAVRKGTACTDGKSAKKLFPPLLPTFTVKL